MNSRDIYKNVGIKMMEDGFTNITFATLKNQEEKSEAIASMNQALLEYSYEKLCEITMPEVVVMDLGVVLDKIDSYLPQDKKEDFFEHYVHCMLNIYNSLENKGVLWSPEETTVPEEYPKLEKEGEYLEFFKTAMEGSNKEAALWLNSYLSTEYSCKFIKNNTK